MLFKSVYLISIFLFDSTKVFGRICNPTFHYGRSFLPKSKLASNNCFVKTSNTMSADKLNIGQCPLTDHSRNDPKPEAIRRLSRSEEDISKHFTWPSYASNYVLNPAALTSSPTPRQYVDNHYYQHQLSYSYGHDVMQHRSMGSSQRSSSIGSGNSQQYVDNRCYQHQFSSSFGHDVIQDRSTRRYMSHYRRSCSVERSSESRKSGIRNTREKQLVAARVWENVTKATSSSTTKKTQKPGFFFTVMSYNVLAQDLLNQHPELYHNCNPKYLNWETRWDNLRKEIETLSPDILCLQEVQEAHLHQYFSLFEAHGYKGLYKKRTGIRIDGCAIYYKEDVIKLVEYETVEFFQPNISVLNRDNVALIAKFAPKMHPSREFVVGTTHLLYNPRRQDVRLAQTQVFLTEVERLSFKGCQENGSKSYVPVILTGDLNSTPDSAVYDLITKGVLKYEDLSERALNSMQNMCNILSSAKVAPISIEEQTNSTEEVTLIELHNSDKKVEKRAIDASKYASVLCSGTLRHNFALKSIYNHGETTNNEGTTFQSEWKTVDYIFYSGKSDSGIVKEDKLILISRYRLPKRSELNEVFIPNKYFGSDHLSLAGKFKLEY